MNRKRIILRIGLAALILGQAFIYFNKKNHSYKNAPIISEAPHSNSELAETHIPGTDRIDKLLKKIITANLNGEDSAILFDELEGAYATLFSHDTLSISQKLRFYAALNDANLSDSLLPDIIAAMTREISIEKTLQLAQRYSIENSIENLEEIVATRFEIAPAESLYWLAASNHENLVRSLLPELISQWAVNDTQAAADFLQQLPDHHEAKDLALGLFIHTVVRKDQDHARSLLVQIQDADYRKYLREEVETHREP